MSCRMGRYGRGTGETGWFLASIYAALTVVVVVWLLRDHPAGFVHERLDINAQALRIPWAWGVAVAVAAGYSLYTMWAVPFVREHVFELSRLKLLGIWAALISGIVEEVVFRQKLMDLLASWGWHAGWQVVVSALAFGLVHAVWILFRGEFAIAPPVIASTTVLGTLLALVYLVAGRNVLPAIVAHTLINLVIEPWLLLAALSRTWQTTQSHNDTVQEGTAMRAVSAARGSPGCPWCGGWSMTGTT